MKYILAMLFLLKMPVWGNVYAAPADTLRWSEFIGIIRKNHPITRQARLLADIAKARRTQALGGFDPKLSVAYDRKLFDGTEYYTFLTPEIKMPLWFGVELKASYTEAEGAYINPENKVPKEGLSYTGFSVPLGKGLLIDKRRAALRQARIFAAASANEQVSMLNNLFLEAGEAYVSWQNKYRIYQLYKGTLDLSRTRFSAVKKGFQNGDRPAIDTTEALTLVQQRELQFQEASLELQKSVYELSSFLWLDNEQPVDPSKLDIHPEAESQVPIITETDISRNPKLLSYDFKLRELELERRLKAENLRPEIGLQLGLLNKGRTPLANVNADYWTNNNKIALQFSLPLTLSAARGELAEAKLKIRDTEWEQRLVRNDLENKLRASLAEVSSLTSQVQILQEAFRANQQLLKGEEIRFRLGESSLFLVNSREAKVLETNEKLLDTQAKLRKAQLKLRWLTGSLPEEGE